MKNKRPIVLVGGGTGGHITPLVAVGEELIRREEEFIFIGGANSREQEIVAKLDWPFYAIASGKLRRDLSLTSLGKNIADFVSVIIGFWQALGLIIRFKPRVIFSKGGPVSLPVVLAAWLLRKPIIIHESDSVMGLANRLAVPLANQVLTAFETQSFSRADQRFLQVGIPIRRALVQASTLKAPQKTRPVIFIIAGIQGAAPINKLIRESLLSLLQLADVIHITGDKEFKIHQELQLRLAQNLQRSYKPFNFVDRQLPYYFQVADLVISRASATTIAEGALFQKAMYLIPLPHAGANHQLINAQLLARVGAVEFDEQSALLGEKFLDRIKELMANSEKRSKLGQRLHHYFSADQSTHNVVEQILRVSKNEERT